MTRIRIARAWCDECLRDCWFSFNENTFEHKHIGIDISQVWENLKAQGYQVAHRAGVFTFTQWKGSPLAPCDTAPLALPLDWQMAIEERESVDTYQEW